MTYKAHLRAGAALVAASLALTLTACGGKNEDASPSDGAAAIGSESPVENASGLEAVTPETSGTEALSQGLEGDEEPASDAALNTGDDASSVTTDDIEDAAEEATETSIAPADAMLVLDASGSMWGEIDGVDKIAIAREVVGEMVADWDTDVSLGLMAYGHNRKGDCDDIELLLPSGTLDNDAFMSEVNDLSPVGMTPLTESVKRAAEALKYTETRATVILVSDGEETCDLDPCATGKALEEAGIDFTAHIIGFDVTEEQAEGLKCLASETGGMYLEANNADELGEAMSNASDMVTVEGPPIQLGDATISVPAEIPAGSTFRAEWTGPKNRYDYLQILDPDGEKTYDYEYIGREDDVSPAKMDAPEKPGPYLVRYMTTSKDVLGETSFTAIEVTATVLAPQTVAAGADFKVEWTGPMNRYDNINIFSEDGEKSYGHDYVYRENDVSPAELRAPEKIGIYEIRYYTRGKNTLASTTIEVIATEATVSAPEEVIAGSDFKVEWTGPKNRNDNINIFSEDGEKSYGHDYVHREDDVSPAELRAPEKVGSYEIRYYTQGKVTLASTMITVLAAEATVTGPSDDIVAGSEFSVEWTGPENYGDHVIIFSEDGEKSFEYDYTYRDSDVSPAKLRAPETVGTYEIRYFTRGKNTLASTMLTVLSAEASISVQAAVAAGATFDVEWTGPENYGDHVIIFREDGEKSYDFDYTYRENDISPAKLEAPGEPGTYEVRYYTRGKNTLASAMIEVE